MQGVIRQNFDLMQPGKRWRPMYVGLLTPGKMGSWLSVIWRPKKKSALWCTFCAHHDAFLFFGRSSVMHLNYCCKVWALREDDTLWNTIQVTLWSALQRKKSLWHWLTQHWTCVIRNSVCCVTLINPIRFVQSGYFSEVKPFSRPYGVALSVWCLRLSLTWIEDPTEEKKYNFFLWLTLL
jgi:hypothetical protein